MIRFVGRTTAHCGWRALLGPFRNGSLACPRAAAPRGWSFRISLVSAVTVLVACRQVGMPCMPNMSA